MSVSEIKTVINDIIDDYNLDIILLVAIVLFGIYTFFLVPIMYVKSTEAVIDGKLVNVTSRASGQIIQSYIMKDQEVKKGDLLMEIDPRDYEQELIKLETDLEINKEKLRMLTHAPLPEDLEGNQADGVNIGVGVNEGAVSNLQNNQINQDNNVGKPPEYAKNETNYTNYSRTYIPEDLAKKNLERKKIVLGDTLQNMSDINASEQKPVEINITKPKIDKTKIDISKDTVESVQKEIKNIESMEEEVKLRLSSTKIFAPQDGIISSVSVNVGDVVNPSDVLCSVIPKHVWVIARVNPQQLDKVKIGQYVQVVVPNYKHRIFKGTVVSVDKTTKVYKVDAADQVTTIDASGQVVKDYEPAYQIKINFIEDYTDFNLPPDTQVTAKIKVKTFINQEF